MAIGGVGMGLTMPNLTITMQQAAPRKDVGIGIALLQSQRMVGAMLGTALTGATVNWVYRHTVANALAGEPGGAAWQQQLANPEILLSQERQAALLGQLAAAGHNGAALIDMAHDALVHAIHVGFWLTIAVGLVSFVSIRKMPRISFRTSGAKVQFEKELHEP
jgi:hypothetical protein